MGNTLSAAKAHPKEAAIALFVGGTALLLGWPLLLALLVFASPVLLPAVLFAAVGWVHRPCWPLPAMQATFGGTQVTTGAVPALQGVGYLHAGKTLSGTGAAAALGRPGLWRGWACRV